MRLYTYALALLLTIGHATAQFDHAAEMGDDEMIEARIQEIADGWFGGDMTDEEFEKLANELDEEARSRLFQEIINRTPPRTWTEAELEELRIQEENHRIRNLEYIIRGNLPHASPENIDLTTIERFVFSDHEGIEGSTFALDRMHDRVYFDPWHPEAWALDGVPFSAELLEEDLERLIQAIEESDLLNWERHFEGERPALPVNLNPDLPPYHMRMFGLANRSWRLGILFSDGTVLRRSGSGFSGLGDFFPPDGQFDILNDFIMTIGTEIQERHAAEAAQSE